MTKVKKQRVKETPSLNLPQILTQFQERRFESYQKKGSAFKTWKCRMKARGMTLPDSHYVIYGYDVL
jgi:hypothetical protein